MKLLAGFLLISSSLSLCCLFLSKLLEPEYFYGAEFDVRVINGFSTNSSLPLVIWCSSDDHGDIGGRALQEGDDFSWAVRSNFWGAAARFLCTVKWDSTRKRFDAFEAERDGHRCGPFRKCSWLVREDGFYFSSDEVNWKKDFSWF
ncbi:hypothetical protein ACJRO7_029756 [Eucalyptus globulus]|uniref:S-protein homolog n=1 Tax=Eucalyptus globulus TaxID=34317 RepID=A0ABD3JF58_EUCGL